MAVFGGGYGSRQSLQLTPEEEESLLSSLGRAGMSTLAYIGESIDKPMAAVRGVLNGDFEEAANIIPFSDAMGITSSDGLLGGTAFQVTDDEDTVYGRDLLETYGLAGENVEGLGGDDWGNIDYGDALADVLGFGIDMINVPMAGPAASLSKAGKLGKMAGLTDEAAAIARASGRGGKIKYRATNSLDDAIRDITEFKNPVLSRQADGIDAATDALAYPNAPLTDATQFVSGNRDEMLERLYTAGDGMGMDRAAVDAVMGERLGSTMSFGGMSMPENVDRAFATAIDSSLAKVGATALGRTARQAFDVPAAGTGTAAGQDFMGPRQQIYRDMGDLRARAVSSQAALAVERQKDLLKYLGDGDETVGYYRALEAPDLDELMGQRQILAREDGTGRVWAPEAGDMDSLNELRGVKRELGIMEDRAKFEGVSFNTLEDSEIDYVTRHVLGMRPTLMEKSAKMFGGQDPSQLLRREFTKDIPGGTAELIKLAKDTQAMESAGDIAAEAYRRFGGGQLTGEAESEFANKMLQLGEFMSKQKPEVRAAGIYGDPLNMIDQRLMSGNKAIANARAVTDTVSDYLSGGVTAGMSLKEAPGARSLGGLKQKLGFKAPEEELAKRTVGDAIGGVGLDRDTALDAIYRKMTPEAREEVRQLLDMPGAADNMISAPNTPGDPGMEFLREGLAKRTLPDEMMDDIGRMQRGLQGPDPTSLVKDGLVQYNRWWKGLQTNPFPSFHVRNFGSGQAREYLRGNDPGSELNMVYRLMTGGEVAAEEALAVPGVRQVLDAQGLGDEEAVNGLRQLIRTYMPTDGQGVSLEDLGSTYTRAADAAGEISGEINTDLGFVGGLDGTAPTGPAQVWDQLKALVPGKTGAEARAANPDWMKPAALRGISGRDTTRFAPVAAGEIAGEGTEILNRIPSWINQLKQGIDPAQAARNVNKSQIDYSTRAFTPLENEMRRLGVMPFYSFCVPSDHTAMTRTGWKSHDELAVGEEVMGYDTATGELSWTEVTAVNVFDHTGTLNRYANRSAEFLFTDGHRWPVRKRACVTNRPYGIYSYPERVIMKTGWPACGDSLIANGQFVDSEGTGISPRLAAILGWVVSDGYHRFRGKYCEMMVYQSPKKFLGNIVDLLGTEPRKPHPETGVVCVPVALKDIKAIVQAGFTGKESLPEIVGKLGRDAADAMWQAMFDAEGCYSGTSRQEVWTQSLRNHPVTVAYQMLCVLTGRTCTTAETTAEDGKVYHNITTRKADGFGVTAPTKSSVQYTGKVWCPTTKLGTWVMSHNGSIVITGNSSRNIPEVASELLNNPTGRTGGLFKGLSRLRSDDEFLPEHIAQTLAIPLGSSEEGDPRYLTGLGLMEEDLLGAVDTGNPLKSAGYEVMGRLSPLIKAPIEYVLGKSLFQSGYQGPRDTEDMDPQLGRLLSNLKSFATGEDQRDAVDTRSIEPLLQMLPGIRAMSTARQLTDKRKYDNFLAPLLANQLTGARVSDVSPAAMDASLQDMIANEYKSLGGRDFQNYYIPQKTKDQMTPEEIQHTLQMRALENLIRKRREQRQMTR